MSFIKSIGNFLFMDPVSGFEQKSGTDLITHSPITHSPDAIRAMIESDLLAGTSAVAVSAVHACARIIAEGLALPPCYVHQTSERGRGLAIKHPLYYLLNASPNDRQTSYEFREMIGWQLALNGDAYVYINRSPRDGSILELLPCDYGAVTISVDQSGLFKPITYYVYGQPVPNANIWHLKGPSALSYQGQSLVAAARKAINLALNTESFGANLFVNGAQPGGIITSKTPLTADQIQQIKDCFAKQAQGIANAHKTTVLPADLTYQAMGSTANDAQWVEARRFQIEEIARYFRVSPTKLFMQVGSQSYASVEQAHISHDSDTDAHWHERFVQSANKALLSPADKRAGYSITIDNRATSRGATAAERMSYWAAGISAGIFTQNEARMGEGFDPSSDPEADQLKRAANIMGSTKTPTGAPDKGASS